MSMTYPGKVLKAEFDPFDHNRFMVLFENDMSLFSIGSGHRQLGFGK